MKAICIYTRLFRIAVSRRAAGLVVIAAMCTLLWAPAFAEQGGLPDGPAIPPGQELLLLEMLGLGAPLPGCDLVDGQVKYTVVKATYACADDEISYELKHRSLGDAASTSTDQFAVKLTSGSAPKGFADALIALIRSREAEFEWVWPTVNPN
jgi:hypothetical protein